MNHQSSRRPLRFGVFEADPASGELSKQGRRIRLAAQPFEILMLLLENPGKVVPREEIQRRLWPDGTFVDFDRGLNAAIAKLREALGDSAANPRFVETVAKRGYRFIAPVDQGPPQTGSQSPAVDPPEATREAAQVESPELALNLKEAARRGSDRTAGDRFQNLLTRPEDVPQNAAPVARVLFLLAQVMYLSFYVAVLAFVGEVADRVGAMTSHILPLVAVIVTAAIGVPLRLYLTAGVLFGARGIRERFLSILFPVLLLLDILWAASPFLLAPDIRFGVALAATAALAYLPFAQRTLVLMGALGKASSRET